MITQNTRLLSFLNELRAGKIHYRLDQHRDDAIMVEVAVPGERWEVEFLTDGTVEAEVFRSDGAIRDESAIQDLLHRHSDKPPSVDETKLNFDERYWDRVKSTVGAPLVRRPGPQRQIFVSTDGKIAVLGRVNRGTQHRDTTEFWFNVESQHTEILSKAESAFVALGCGSAERILLVPFPKLAPLLDETSKTQREGFVQYNLRILADGSSYVMALPDMLRIDLSKYILAPAQR